MNTYKKYCPNVFVAQCTEKHEKGDTIIVKTKYGKENECIVHNFVGYTGTKEKPMYCYSITRADGYNNQVRAKRKAGQYEQWAESADSKAKAYHEASQEGRDFLILGEPIKVGHHSEASHRALIKRNQNRMRKMVEFSDKADYHRERAAYWESMANKIDLSMPESLEFFEIQLEEAKEYHQFLKDNPAERPHGMSLSYASKKVKDLKSKHETAVKLWS
jgi:hypothetical protein